MTTAAAINEVLNNLKGEDITATLTFWDGETMVPSETPSTRRGPPRTMTWPSLSRSWSWDSLPGPLAPHLSGGRGLTQ